MDNVPMTVEEARLDDWSAFHVEEEATANDAANVHNSLTASIKQMLYADSEPAVEPSHTVIDASFDSVIEEAQREGLSLENWVQRDPDKAIRMAEATLASWTNVQTQAALTGAINDSDGKTYAINKNQTKMLCDRVELARKQLELVQEYAYTSYKDGEKRKDLLQRVMFRRALHGDNRMAIYLHDRVEGHPTEAKTVDMDYDNAYNVYQIIHTLFDKQLNVLNSGNGTQLICCSRRAGKTHLLVAIMLVECLRRPNIRCIYIGETAELSEQLINTAANTIIDTCQLKDKRGRRLNWKKLDNGSSILVRGLSNTKDPDQIRGNAAKIIVIDEFFHLKSDLLEYMQREVLQPMQMDYADDYKFICAGTPPSIKDTFGELAWKTWDVPHHFWTWEDNPYPRNASVEVRREYVEKVLKEKGLTWDSSFARREYGGEWVYDDDLLLYPEFSVFDEREGVPQFQIDQVLFGIDYGVSDNDVLLGIAWDSAAGRGYVFHEDKFSRLDIKDRTISQLQYLRAQVKYAWGLALEFFPTLSAKEANKRILWDADDNDQHVTDDLNINVRLNDQPDLRLNIRNAHKTDKVIMFDKIRDLLRTGGLLLPAGGKTVHECMSTVLKRGPNGQVYPDVDDKVFHPDILPAMRYALYNVL